MYMRNLFTIIAVVGLLVTVGCKDKPTKKPQKPVKTAVVQKPVVKDTVKKVVEEPKVKPDPPKPADKYFLIAGSFASMDNANVFKTKLIADGYNAQVIERPGGPNGEFYKVAYKGFYDRKEAYAELRTARNSEDHSDVWLLVKK